MNDMQDAANDTVENDYWAAEPTDEIGAEIKSRIDNYYRFIRGFGRLSIWHRTYNQYYMNVLRGAKLFKSGASGEFTLLNVNHFHNILAHIKTLTISQRPEFEPRAANSDYESQAQTILASGLLDYYMRTKGLESYIASAVEQSLIFGESWIMVDWDATEGKVYGLNDNGSPIHEGDVKYANFTPLDIIRDYSRNSASGHDWLCARTFKNKYTMAAKFPLSKDDIMNAPCKSDEWKDLTFVPPMLYDDSDEIIVYEFFHKPTAALPKGRVVSLLETGEVIMDGPLPYRDIPLYRIAAEEQATCPFGFTVAFDLLPLQENLDNMLSSIATNQNAFGVQNIIVEQGSGIQESDVFGGLNLLKIPKGAMEPKALQLCATPPEVFTFVKDMIQQMETISGVNSVARGQPEASLKSGAALALVQSMAIQFNMPLQLSYTRLVERIGAATLNLLKDYAAVPRIATIAGKANRSLMKEFTGKDLERIDRVIVNLGNPMTQTTAGKVNLAETLLQNKLVTDADQYIQVLTTGNLQPVVEGKQSELMLIRSENEAMQDNNAVQAIITDNHAQHINEHKVILASPEARMNPQLVQTTLAHVQQHIDFLKNPQYQDLLKLLNEQPIAPSAPQPGQAPQAQPTPPGTAGAPIQPGNAIHPVATGMNNPVPLQNQQPGHVNGVALPSAPRNPLTHEKGMLPEGAGRNTVLSGHTNRH